MAAREQHTGDDRYASLTRAVRDLVGVMREAGLTRLEIEHGDLRIALEAGCGNRSAPVSVSSESPAAGTDGSTADATREDETFTIDAPMVGTFYAAPAPDAEPFVQVGDVVEPGQTVAIVEAMKIMNEIVSERRGAVVAILVENGQAVEYGQPLIRLRAIG